MTRSARAPLRIDLAGGWTDVPAFADHEGGAVVNFTINRYVHASIDDAGAIIYAHDVRPGGLGSSACEHVLAAALRDPDADLDDIAEAAFMAESVEGVVGGRQDQYVACYGGLNFMTFPTLAQRRAEEARTGEPALPVRIEPLQLPEPAMKALMDRLVLVGSGVERLSGEIHEDVWSAYARHDDDVTGALLALQQYGRAMRDALVASDFGGVRQVLFENWVQQKRLHESVTNDTVDALFERALAAGATAGKACGAGGGGALVFYASSADAATSVRRALSEVGAQIIDFAYEPEGLVDEGSE
ncbi:MAG TPA: GHMP kinase [Dehalococcoidia bacterium]|nr:GHMP kinase [Dehalococcoidia bacterium]